MTNGKVYIKDVYAIVNRIEDKIDKKFVTLARFRPVEALVYGMAGLLLTVVVLSLLRAVVK